MAEARMAERYIRMLEPLDMYLESLKKMLLFQQHRFHDLSGIRCYLGGKRKKDPPCHHVACPMCWHRATIAYLCDIYRSGHPTGVRLRVLTNVPPALEHVAFVTDLTAGETPWVHDIRCEVDNPDSRRLVILTGLSHLPQGDEDTGIHFPTGDNTSPMTVTDFFDVDSALDAWFAEAPPPFTYPDYDRFVWATKDYDFGECIHSYSVLPGYVTAPEVDDSLRDL